jgi:hypothetical protein
MTRLTTQPVTLDEGVQLTADEVASDLTIRGVTVVFDDEMPSGYFGTGTLRDGTRVAVLSTNDSPPTHAALLHKCGYTVGEDGWWNPPAE